MLGMIYDRLSRKEWSERAANNEENFNVDEVCLRMSEALLMQAEAEFDAIQQGNKSAQVWRVRVHGWGLIGCRSGLSFRPVARTLAKAKAKILLIGRLQRR